MKKKIGMLVILLAGNKLCASQEAISTQVLQAQKAPAVSKKIMAACAIIPPMNICVVHFFPRDKQKIPCYIRLIESGSASLSATLVVNPPDEHLTQRVALESEQKKLFNLARIIALGRIKRNPSSETLRTFLLFDDLTVTEPFYKK